MWLEVERVVVNLPLCEGKMVNTCQSCLLAVLEVVCITLMIPLRSAAASPSKLQSITLIKGQLPLLFDDAVTQHFFRASVTDIRHPAFHNLKLKNCMWSAWSTMKHLSNVWCCRGEMNKTAAVLLWHPSIQMHRFKMFWFDPDPSVRSILGFGPRCFHLVPPPFRGCVSKNSLWSWRRRRVFSSPQRKHISCRFSSRGGMKNGFHGAR